jgi:hypothetical protein
MNKIAVKNRIIDLEAEIGLLKKAVTNRPDFEVDDEIWKKVKPAAKKARTKVFKKTYG